MSRLRVTFYGGIKMNNFDIKQVYQFWDVFKGGNQLTEIRLIASDGKTASGYFTDANVMIEAVKPYVNDYSVYFTINSINPDCYGRPQRDKIIPRVKNTTTDSEIIGRDWVLLDLDSKRATGVNATEEQLGYAKKKANEVYKFLKDNGFNTPLVICSGSGIHLYIRCALLPTEENNNLVKRFTQAMSMLFSDEQVDIDEKVFNLGRIARVCGYYNRKGTALDKERPQRLCEFVRIPDEIKVNEREYFEKIAALYPEDVKPTRENNYSTEKFDLDAFIAKHNIDVTKIEQVAGGKKYILKHCCFNEAHSGKDAVIFQKDNGALSYVCLHNSCKDKGWKEFRAFFEPDAYSSQSNYVPSNRYKRPPIPTFAPIEQTDEKGKVWVKMSEIKRPVLDVKDYIPSGVPQIDKLMIGFKRKHTTIWSGYRGSAKSTILNMLILNAAQQGYKSALWTGELDGTEVKQWLYLQAAGKSYNRKSQFSDYYYTPSNVCDKIDEWIDKYLWLFNNEYGDNYKQLEYEIRKLKEQEDIDMVILDSLMVLGYDDLDGDRNEKQKNLMVMITKLAKQLNIHIHIVAHPHKGMGQFLRPNNISGSGHIADLAQNIFILHRINTDFEQSAKDFLPKRKIEEINSSMCTNVIEICKCRDKGTAVDSFIKLYFEIESNRLKNDIAEHIIYGWQEEATPQELPQASASSDIQPNTSFEEYTNIDVAFGGDSPF